MATKKMATFRLEPEVWQAFQTLCERSKTNATQALTNFVRHSVEADELDAIAFSPDDGIGGNIDVQALEARLTASIDSRFSKLEALILEGKKPTTARAKR